MRVEPQFSIFLINKPGVLAAVTTALAKAKVNIVALALMDSGEHGALRIVVDEPDAARRILGRTHDRWTEADVLVLELKNEPGAFAAISQRLADEHINISYAYCTSGAGGGRTTAVFKVADLKKAEKVVRAAMARRKQSAKTLKPSPARKKRS